MCGARAVTCMTVATLIRANPATKDGRNAETKTLGSLKTSPVSLFGRRKFFDLLKPRFALCSAGTDRTPPVFLDE